MSDGVTRIATLLLPMILAMPLRAQEAPPGIRSLTYSRDGRLVAAAEGDLWLRSARGTWTRITNGPAWDRDPGWTPDGGTLVFVSDRDGQDDLYRMVPTPAAVPERLTNDTQRERTPVGVTGNSIWFVRGEYGEARLWERTAAGEIRRVTQGSQAETAPAASTDGQRVAWIQSGDGGRRIRVRRVGETRDSVVTAERNPELVSWAPDGTRLVVSSATPRPALWILDLATGAVQPAADVHGVPAWATDAHTILVAEARWLEPGYNGDPDRVGDRSGHELLVSRSTLHQVIAPARMRPAARLGERQDVDRVARNGDAWDRFSRRIERDIARDTASAERVSTWRNVVAELRPSAVAARTDSALEDVLQRAIARRPLLRHPAEGRAAVSSAHPVATRAGLEVLGKGGNVIDAAVAVSFALGVVEPDASGIGGYGEMVIHLAGMSRPVVIEFMARVPEEASLANAALLTNGRYPTDGPVLAMVPGTVAGMHTAWKRFGSGRVPWKDLLAPAIRAARDGYEVSDGLATTLRRERDGFLKYPGSRALFFRDGKPLTAGDTVRNADLAWTLEQIATGGADGFYRGEVARRMVADLRGQGSAMRTTDLARYFAAEREPVHTTYRGHAIYSSAPPAGGGATLAAQLNALELVDPPKPWTGDVPSLHAMITAWQLVPSSRNRIADPSLWPVDVSPFISKDTARARWRCFDPQRAVTPRQFRGDTLVCGGVPASSPDAPASAASASVLLTEPCNAQDHAQNAECRSNGTTAFAVADADGNAVAVTQTLGTWGGTFHVTPGLGFLYNDKLTSYGTDPAQYGARLPYARHGSTLAPTVVLEGATGRARLALGAAGNAWINSAVYQTLVGVVDLGLSPQQALEMPRFLPSRRATADGTEYVIDLEDGVSPGVRTQLERMGYRFNLISLKGELRMGYGAAVGVRDGRAQAGADPRRSGSAGAIP